MLTIHYGGKSTYIDVTDIVTARHGIDTPYNTILDDPVPGVCKRLVIKSDGLCRPIYVREDTPISINRTTCKSIIIIYILHYQHQHIIPSLLEIEGATIHVWIHGIDHRIGEIRSMSNRIIIHSTYEDVNIPDSRDVYVLYMRSTPTSPISDTLYHLLIRQWRHCTTILSIIDSIDVVCHIHYRNSIPYDTWWSRASHIKKRGILSVISDSHRYCDVFSPIGYNIGGTCSTPTTILRHRSIGRCIYTTPRRQGFGLFNQLNNLCNSIVVGHMTGRDIVNMEFMPHFNRHELIPLSYVVDVMSLNNTISKMGLQSRLVYKDSISLSPSKVDYESAFLLAHTDICDVASMIVGMDDHLSLGCTMQNTITNFESFSLLRSIRYTHLIEEVIDYCQSLIGRDYHSVHLRLEDDWITLMYLGQDFNDTTQSIWLPLKKTMDSLYKRDDHVFIATHLGRCENRNNYLLDVLRESYPDIIYGIDWRSKFDLPQGREIDALIDYLICCNGKSFIGIARSTFSGAIHTMMEYEGRPSIMV